MSFDRLAPCPFCGGQAFAGNDRTSILVRCSRCFAQGPARSSEKDAVEEWNRRRQPAQPHPDAPEGLNS